MAHPEEVSVEQRMKKEHLSPLMRAKAKAKDGAKVCACPFGCGVKESDDHGYCRHLVGFTKDQKFYEPIVRVRGGRRQTVVKMKADPNETIGEDGEPVMVPDLPRCKPGDKFMLVTCDWRVYRDVDGMGKKLEEKRIADEALKRAHERRLLIEEIKNDPEAKAALLEALTTGPAAEEAITTEATMGA
jgi:hypothetical protein